MVKKEAVKKFPDAPGVYLMKDRDGHVLYIGKALSLKKRLSSYFLKSQASIKTQVLMDYVQDIEYIQTRSEHEALILEDRLIKKHRPRFNIVLKDDKSFPYIKITHHDFPRIFVGRRKKTERDVDYFGPYTSAKLLRRAVTILRKSFPFCSCRRFPKRACLNYDLGLCPAPCKGKISRKDYLNIVRAFEDFLSKKDTEIINELSFKLRKSAREEHFEEAARLRDQLEALSLLISLKKIDARKSMALICDFEHLGLKREPVRLEAFDISNVSGGQSVGAMVSFYKGLPDKDNYRRFRIKTVSGIDDYAMIREVVRRRYGRLSSEGLPLPDLIVIDGGKGHLDAASQVLKALKLKIPVVAIAKLQELIYVSGRRLPIKLKSDSAALKLIQRARDEAHRFALKYHRLLRAKNAFS